MTAEQWEEIKRIFGAALNLPAPERDDYVRAACADREDVQAQVRELLENHHDASVPAELNYLSDDPVFADGEMVAERFLIVRFIARGGMGEVYEAFDETLKTRVAIKTLLPELTSEQGALERFRREITVARGVGHENVCRIFDYSEHRAVLPASGLVRRIPCLTMELLDGQSLAEFLRRKRPLSAEEALPLIRQIASGLGVLHQNGIVHRDLKPSNIMLARGLKGQVRVVVMDFGLARGNDTESDLFERGTEFAGGSFAGGSPYFMAPELLNGGVPDFASDIYAFGLIVDEMVTKTRAFTDRNTHTFAFSRMSESPVSPADRSEGLPAHWVDAILRCLDSEPARRFASPMDMVADLDAVAVPAAPPARVATEGRISGRRVLTKWNVRRRLLAAAFAFVLLLFITAFATGYAGNRQDTTIEVFDIENRTEHPEYDYLCKGTTEELMRRLAQVNGVRVIPIYAPRSSAQVGGKGRLSLQGTLQAWNNQVRLSVMVMDNETHTVAWSDKYDRSGLANPLNLQSDIAQGTVAALRERLPDVKSLSFAGFSIPVTSPLLARLLPTVHARPQIARAPTSSNSAFDLYMRGRHLLEETSPDSASAAITYFRQAIDQDSTFALGHSALADACLNLMDMRLATDPDLLRCTREHSQLAVQFEPGLADAWASLAALRQAEWDWSSAEESYRRALELKPSFARAHLWYSGLILQFGRFDEALAEGRRALELDPYDRSTPRTLGLYLFLARRYADAATVLEHAVEGKDLPTSRHNLGQVYAQLGYISSGAQAVEYRRKALAQADAVAEIERRGSPNGTRPRPSLADRMYAICYTQEGRSAEAQPWVDRLTEDMYAGRTSPVVLAWIFALRGDSAQALDLLERALAAHDRRLLYIKVNPYFDSLHGNSRFEEIVRKVKL